MADRITQMGPDEIRIQYEFEDVGKFVEPLLGRKPAQPTELFVKIDPTSVTLRIVEPENDEEEEKTIFTIISKEAAQQLFDWLKSKRIVG
jgi:hypothetical protein